MQLTRNLKRILCLFMFTTVLLCTACSGEGTQNSSEKTISVTSKITGETLTAEEGISTGVYKLTRYSTASDEGILPDPVSWSDGKLVEVDYDLDDFDELGFYYEYEAASDEEAEALATEYVNYLSSSGFSYKEKFFPNYLVWKDDLGEIEINYYYNNMSVFLPLAYDFDIEKRISVRISEWLPIFPSLTGIRKRTSLRFAVLTEQIKAENSRFI